MVKLPFNPEILSHKERAIYEEMAAKRKNEGAPFGGPYAALMNHPELCQRIEALGFYLKFQGHLPRDVYQFVVLSVAKETNSAFEWYDHVDHAKASGVSEAVIEEVRTKGALTGEFQAPYQLAADVFKATFLWKNIPETIQTEAIQTFGILGFVELVVLSGFYQMFSAINQGLDVSSENRKNPF